MEEVAADLAQELIGEPAAAIVRMRPDAHELHRVGRDRGVFAFRGDDSIDDADHGTLLLDQLANALAIAAGIAFERIDPYFLAMHRRACGYELFEIAQRRVTRRREIGKVDAL